MEYKQKKRLIIISVYLAIFLSLFLYVRSVYAPEPTCSDGKKNQNEEGIDCGGPCAKCVKIKAQPLQVIEAGFVPGGMSGNYDFWASVDNPNHTYGGKNFNYEITFLDASGNALAKRTGSTFILPGERKYVIETNFPIDTEPKSAKMTVSDPEWVEFVDYFEKPALKIVNKNYNEINSGVGFAEAKGLLKNESDFDFAMIKIKAALKDDTGKVVALNSTEMRTVKSGEERDFRMLWPNRFPGSVANMETQIEVNIFSADAFMKRYFKTQEFQRY